MNNSWIVGKRFLEIAENQNQSLTVMQLLKLVYIAHGWMLALYHRPLVDDDIEAWQYGPVIRNLYNEIRVAKGKRVFPDSLNDAIARLDSPGSLDKYETDLIQQVFNRYGEFSGNALSRLTHSKGSPWDQVYDAEHWGARISDDRIESHYSKLAAAG